MRWIRQYTLYTYIKQRYHRRSLWIVVMVFVFSYILAWLSPLDVDKVFIELSTSILELVFALWAIVIAVVLWNKKSYTTIHIIHSQWLSYQKIFLAHRLVGATGLLYLCIVLYLGLLLVTLFDISVFGIVLTVLYLLLKLLLLYTIVFVLSHQVTAIIAAVFWLASYVLFYSFWLIQSWSQWLSHISQSFINVLVYVLPQFVSIGQSIVHIDWLSANIFTIVISYGIYIVCLLILGAQSYAKISWK